MTTEKKTQSQTQGQKKASTKPQEAFFTGYEEFAALGKENMEAAVKSGQLFAKGFEALNAVLFQVTREVVEENLKASKAIMGCKTPEDAFELQNDLVRANYERALTESRKITEMSVKLAEEASQPITQRVNASVEVMSKNIAA